MEGLNQISVIKQSGEEVISLHVDREITVEGLKKAIYHQCKQLVVTPHSLGYSLHTPLSIFSALSYLLAQSHSHLSSPFLPLTLTLPSCV